MTDPPARPTSPTFLDTVLEHDKVWVCTGADLARHWLAHHPYRPNA